MSGNILKKHFEKISLEIGLNKTSLYLPILIKSVGGVFRKKNTGCKKFIERQGKTDIRKEIF